MTTDEAALMKSIAANPDDDTGRLVYADWLDENGRPERAEYIRAAVRLARWGACPGAPHGPPGSAPTPGCDCAARGSLHKSATQLLAAHEAEWRKAARCPECWPEPGVGCIACDGTGDVGALMRRWTIGERHDAELLKGAECFRYEVVFRRGFPDRVVCCFDDVVHPSCDIAQRPVNWLPTAWATAVVTYHPVTEFLILDKIPYHNGYGNCWFSGDRIKPTLSVPASSELPSVLFDMLAASPAVRCVPDRYSAYHTPHEAVLALCQALGLFVRAHAKSSSTPP